MIKVIDVTINAINSTATPERALVTEPDTLLNFVLDQNSILTGYKLPESNAICVCRPDGSFIGSWTMPNSVQANLVDLNTVSGLFHYCVSVEMPRASSDVPSTPPKLKRLQFEFDPLIQNGL